MVRISGVDIPTNKKIGTALSYIFGIGPTLAKKILIEAQIDQNKRSKLLTEEEIAKIRDIIDSNYKVEGDLKQVISMNIKRLMDLGCYRGSRHKKQLPVRGQRTHSNARTRRKKNKATISLKQSKTT